jgi:hypothetical protein
MSFIQRELDRISMALREPRFADRCDQLRAAQQALSWALEPEGFNSPFKSVAGNQPNSGDCSPGVYPVAS